MNGYNRVILLGYLGHNPQLHTAASGKQYTNLSVATRRAGPTEDGKKEVVTDWHLVKVWGQQAETCTRYLKKGAGVMIEGYLAPYEHQKENGKTNKIVGINAIKVEFLPRAKALEA